MQQPLIGACSARQECDTWGSSGFCDRAGVYSEGVHLSFVFLVLFFPDWVCFPFFFCFPLLLLFLLLFSTGTGKQQTAEICPRSSSMSI